jgi:hypothetical protein
VQTVSTSESGIPTPVASVPEVLGGSTAAKLDSGFTDAVERGLRVGTATVTAQVK